MTVSDGMRRRRHPDGSRVLVITPSISTSAVPLTVTMMITRNERDRSAAASRKIVCSGERLLRVNSS